jgi:hypothetical protein
MHTLLKIKGTMDLIIQGDPKDVVQTFPNIYHGWVIIDKEAFYCDKDGNVIKPPCTITECHLYGKCDCETHEMPCYEPGRNET